MRPSRPRVGGMMTERQATKSSKHGIQDPRPLAGHVRESLERYFDELNGQAPSDLYALVLAEVELPLLEVVMTQTRGNISKAAEYLGLNRATLRKKLRKYDLD